MSDQNKRAKFLEDIRVEKDDVLDPNERIPNIARLLGVSQDIMRNPEAMSAVRLQLELIINKEYPDFLQSKTVTQQQIDNVIKEIKLHVILTDETIARFYSMKSPLMPKTPEIIYSGININKELGTVELQRLCTNFHGEEDLKNSVESFTYSPSKNSEVAFQGTTYGIDEKNQKLFLSTKHNKRFNTDGIEMYSEIQSYDRIGQEDVLAFHVVSERNAKYPFVAKRDVKVSNRLFQGEKAGTTYITTVNPYSIGMKLNETVTFENMQQIEEYYKENKEKVREMFNRLPSPYCPFESMMLMREGFRKLGREAGIIPQETEQEL